MLKIRKIDEFKQIVQGLVYEPLVMDSHGDMMTAEDVETMAHNFMKNVVLSKSIDAQHDNVPKNAYPIESFIARANDPDYPAGAWVLSVKVVDVALWEAVKKGEINGFSFEAYVTKTNTVVMVDTVGMQVIATEPDPEDGHVHYAAIKMNEDGLVTAGRTSTVNGHSHAISKGTATDEGIINGRVHRHRFIH